MHMDIRNEADLNDLIAMQSCNFVVQWLSPAKTIFRNKRSHGSDSIESDDENQSQKLKRRRNCTRAKADRVDDIVDEL